MKRRRRHHNQGKRSKARRAYTDEPDEMVEARRSGLTQERSDSLRRRWLRAEERRFELTKVAKFAKPVAPPKPKGRTNRQRRNERRKRPEPPAESWPTNRAVRRAEDAVGWDEAAAELGVAAAAAAATQKEEEEEAAAEPVEASLDDDDDDDDDDEKREVSDVESEEEARGEVADEALERCGVSDARTGVVEAQFGACLTAEECAVLKERSPAYESVEGSGEFERWAWSGRALSLDGLESEVDRLCATVRSAVGDLNPAQLGLLRALAPYRDVVATNAEAAGKRTRHARLLSAALAHCVDHALRCRARVARRDKKVGKGRGDEEEGRDQGFTRPRVLVLVPTRGAAHEAVLEIERLVGDRASIANRRAFEDEFGKGSDDGRAGPPDWAEVFGANTDDDCEMGIALTPGRGKKREVGTSFGVAVKLMSPPEDSDVVVASPLAIRLKLERDQAPDWLSSIEIALVVRAEVMLMQNWDHVEAALAACNRRPRALDSLRCDLSRLRKPLLEDGNQGHACRQTIVLSRFSDPRLRALVDAPGRSTAAREFFDEPRFRNRAGAARLAAPPVPDIASPLATALEAGGRHVFQFVRAPTPAEAADAKVRHLKTKLLPPLLKNGTPGTLVVCHSYHEFLACRAALRTAAANFVAVHDYSRGSEVSRARSRFYHAEVPILLYSARAHFYHRYRLRGAHRLIFVSPPDFAHFYAELVNFMFDKQSPDQTLKKKHVLLLYTSFDALAIERIVGARRARAMLAQAANNPFAATADAHIFENDDDQDDDARGL
ncbi:hypothetical protein CTAYLR_001566 [Chrysophaeum taylorii]|uniref:U3 small nucleolar RNA-associated protein 25 n=1 Tax=Chrysophaeum taylorii TaxID=2483200 RepID=A0AAD7XLN5_9STRA|nr:hypothetical protein CTAYLR_001566 [Chrysophaeum taylorii]